MIGHVLSKVLQSIDARVLPYLYLFSLSVSPTTTTHHSASATPPPGYLHACTLHVSPFMHPPPLIALSFRPSPRAPASPSLIPTHTLTLCGATVCTHTEISHT